MKIIKYLTAIAVGVLFFGISVYAPEYMMKYSDRNRFSTVIEIRDDTMKSVYKYTLTDREKLELLSKRYINEMSIVKETPYLEEDRDKLDQIIKESYLILMDNNIIPEIEFPNAGDFHVELQKVIDINYPEIYAEFYFVYYEEAYESDFQRWIMTVDKESGKPLLISCYNAEYDYEQLNAEMMIVNWLKYMEINDYEVIYKLNRASPVNANDEENVFAMGILIKNSDGSVIVVESSYSRNGFSIGCYYEEDEERARAEYFHLKEQ